MANRRICSIEGCGKTHAGLGYCVAHYKKFKRYGYPLVSVKTKEGEPRKFMMEVALPYTGDDCLAWPFSRQAFGHGTIHHEGRGQYVHRVLCKIKNGPPPGPKYEAAHSCGNGNLGCVNPNHIRWDTRAGNFADRLAHGTDARGSKSVLSKLVEAQVIEIQRLKNIKTSDELGRIYGVKPGTIRSIWCGRTWGWLKWQ